MKKLEAQEGKRKETSNQNMVTSFYNFPLISSDILLQYTTDVNTVPVYVTEDMVGHKLD